MPHFTVIGYYPDNNQPWASSSEADTWEEAVQKCSKHLEEGSRVCVCGVLEGDLKCVDTMDETIELSHQYDPIRCVVACTNASGEPDFYFCKVRCSPEDIDNGHHYDLAEERATQEGYGGSMVVFDENDGSSFLFDHFSWESASVIEFT
jgi:hypothetical protein